MPRIHSLTIKNFRGIRSFSNVFTSDFVCLIGRGDSGKSSILEAISAVLSPSWTLQFFDNDFHNCNTASPIEIEVTLIDLPDELIREDKFGMYQCGVDLKTGDLHEDIEDEDIAALRIRLEVKKDLEPKWEVVTDREIGSKLISAADRGRFNVFLVSDYLDRHFSWNKGSPLYTLLRQEDTDEDTDGTHMIDALREAKTNIDKGSFNKFDTAIEKVKASAAVLGMNILKTGTTIDYRDIVTRDGKLCLHDEKIPFRLKGKGSKRLISFAIQSAIAEIGGIPLIDEVEQGLEPDRVQQLVNSLKNVNHGQVFLTTHSRDVLVEVSADNVFLMRSGSKQLVSFDSSLQGTLRSNPEAFFAKAVLVCEGPTEIGVCRALNEHRISNGKKNMSYLGVRLANGGGSQMIEYSKAFNKSGFPVCLFCDSDSKPANAAKSALIEKGVGIIDWDNEDCLEMAIMRDLPFDLLKSAFGLAAIIKHDGDISVTVEAVRNSVWESVKAKFGTSCPASIEETEDSLQLRLALAKASTQREKEWFKTVAKGYRLGKLMFDHYDQIPDDSKLKKQLENLSTWIDHYGA